MKLLAIWNRFVVALTLTTLLVFSAGLAGDLPHMAAHGGWPDHNRELSDSSGEPAWRHCDETTLAAGSLLLRCDPPASLPAFACLHLFPSDSRLLLRVETPSVRKASDLQQSSRAPPLAA